jgi:hypothetical protein
MKTLSLLTIILFFSISAIAQPWIEPTAGSIYYQGNVGIGTTSPAYTLDVTKSVSSDYIAFINNTSATNGYGLRVRGGIGLGYVASFANQAGSTKFSIYNDGTTYINGNVGIGTTGSFAKLQVGVDPGFGTLHAATTGAIAITDATRALLEVQQSNSVRGVFQAVANTVGFGSQTAHDVNIYVNSTNVVSIKSGAPASSLYIQNNGNVGIGTSNPGALLHLGQNGGAASDIATIIQNTYTLAGSTDETASIWFKQGPYSAGGISSVRNGDYITNAPNIASSLAFYTTNGGSFNTEQMRITNNGYVGIGTTAPSNNLNVYTTTNTGGITITGGSGATNTSLILKNNSSGGNSWDISSTGGGHGYGDGKLLIGLGFSPKMTINGVGNVGIGTTSPADKLSIYGGNGVGLGIDVGGAAGNAGKMLFTYSSGAYNIGKIEGISRSGGGGDLNFYTSLYGDALTSQMTITRAGNIGIGTANPEAKLTVKGKIVASEIQVKEIGVIPDYVFKPDYQLMSLDKVEDFVKQNQHLPEVPSEKEFKKDGMNMAEMNALLLKKVEELTLYVIEQSKQTIDQNKQISEQNKQISEQNKQIGQLKEENKIIRNLIAK